MDQQIKTEWLELLKGEFADKQGVGFLQVNGKYCCLGVLCELAVRKEIIPAPVPPTGTRIGYMYGNETYKSQTCIPIRVREWCGLKYGQTGVLMDLNDVSDSFDAVINLIEKY